MGSISSFESKNLNFISSVALFLLSFGVETLASPSKLFHFNCVILRKGINVFQRLKFGQIIVIICTGQLMIKGHELHGLKWSKANLSLFSISYLLASFAI